MAKKVKLAFIGCGGMARFHLKGLKDLKEEGNELFSIEAVCDVKGLFCPLAWGHK